MAKIADDIALKLGRDIADLSLAMMGVGGLGGRQSSIGKMLTNLSRIVQQEKEQKRDVQERAKRLDVTPKELEVAEQQKEILDQLEEIRKSHKQFEERGYEVKLDPSFDKIASSYESLQKDIKKMSDEANKTELKAADKIAEEIKSHASAVREQPKRTSEEIKKVGFGEKLLSVVKSGLREVAIGGERRRGAVELAFNILGLGGLEQELGISERIERFLERRKEKKEEEEKKLEEEEKKAKLLEITPEEYRERIKELEERREKFRIHEERLALGLPGLEEVEKWEEEEEEKRVKLLTEKKRKAITAGVIPKQITAGVVPKELPLETTKALLPEISESLIEGIKEGISEELKTVSSHLENITEHTEGTQIEVRELKNILTRSVDDATRSIIEPIKETKKVTDKVVENTEKLKESAEKQEKDKIGLKDIFGILRGGFEGLLGRIPGFGRGGLGRIAAGALGRLAMTGAGKLAAGLGLGGIGGGLLGLGGTGALAGFGVHQAVQAFRGKETLIGEAFGKFGEAVTGGKYKGAGWLGSALYDVIWGGKEEEEKKKWQEKLKEIEERKKTLLEKKEEIIEELESHEEAIDDKVKDIGSKNVKAMGEIVEGLEVDLPYPITPETPQERALARTAEKVRAQRELAEERGLLKPATTEAQLATKVYEAEPASGFVMSRKPTLEEREMWKRAAARKVAGIKLGPEIVSVPAPEVLGEKKMEVDRPVIVTAPPATAPQATIHRPSIIEDFNLSVIPFYGNMQ